MHSAGWWQKNQVKSLRRRLGKAKKNDKKGTGRGKRVKITTAGGRTRKPLT